jgi:purine-binding chemotaxis protein CheW
MPTPGPASRGPIDWDEVRRRVEKAQRLGDGGTALSPEREQAILHERARELARPSRAAETRDELELITFALADETYAMETRYIIAAFRLTDLCPLPGARAPIFGVSAWRGDLLTILDLRSLLGVSVTSLNDLSRVLVLGERRAVCGVIADAVLDLVRVPAMELQDPSHGVTMNRALIHGITRDAKIVLDGKAVLNSYADQN